MRGILLWAFAFLVLGGVSEMLGSLGCSENVYSGTPRGDVCSAFAFSAAGGLRWYLTAFAPCAALLVLVAASRSARAHVHRTGIAIALATVVVGPAALAVIEH